MRIKIDVNGSFSAPVGEIFIEVGNKIFRLQDIGSGRLHIQGFDKSLSPNNFKIEPAGIGRVVISQKEQK